MKKYIKRLLRRLVLTHTNQQGDLGQLARSLHLTPMTEHHPDDIFVVGFPKSGNTWFQNLVAGLVYGVRLEYMPFELINEIVPTMGRKYYRRYTTPMYFKSHYLPEPDFRRVVYLVRDGRDAMVSYYHFAHSLGQGSTWEELIKTGDIFGRGLWHEHVQAWSNNPYDADMIRIRYEDLKQQPLIELRRFCDFAKLNCDDEWMEEVIEQASFANMQQREDRFRVNFNFPEEETFFRRGKTGSYQDEMPPHILEVFMQQASDTLRDLGYVDGAFEE